MVGSNTWAHKVFKSKAFIERVELVRIQPKKFRQSSISSMKRAVKIVKTGKTVCVQAMKKQLLAPINTKGVGRVLKDSPFRRIPAAARYDIVKQPKNFLLEQVGINIRLPKIAITEKLPENEAQNQYMKHILKRIRTLVDKGLYAKA